VEEEEVVRVTSEYFESFVSRDEAEASSFPETTSPIPKINIILTYI
jgi:hypothetical protein